MAHDQQIPGDILGRVFNGTASEAEQELVRRWMVTMDISDTAVSDEKLQAAKQEMLYRVTATPPVTVSPPPAKTAVKLLTIWKVAAAAVVFAFLSWFLLIGIRKGRKEPVYVTIATTGKDAKHIQLPDGSAVWLNARSKLEYIADEFNMSHRQVRLTGEGYFEITKDDTRPFIVISENIATQVLGTSFNIETYPGEAEIRVALVNGAVAVKDMHTNNYTLLHPNEMLRYSKGNKKWGVVSFSSNMVRNWLNGHLIFEELPLADVLDRFAYKYGVTLQYDKELVKHKRVTGDFSPDKWQTVLDNILFIHKLKYTTKNGIVYINKR